MRKFNPFRFKLHRESSNRTKTTRTRATERPNSTSYTVTNTNDTISTQSITISAPIINCSDKSMINDKHQPNEDLREKLAAMIENDNIEEQVATSKDAEKTCDEYDQKDDQVD